MPYRFDLSKTYKIWISADPNIFLGQENQLRLVGLRKKHPDLAIYFVYSARCLSDAAKNNLERFCKQHNLIPVDFDSDIRNKISSDETNLDWQAYQKASLEIDKALSNEGGNLAAASDIMRLLEPTAILGLYADHDVDLDLTKSPQSFSAETPILIQGETDDYICTYNNEVLLLSTKQDGALEDDAKTYLNKLKENVLNNYRDQPKKFFEEVAEDFVICIFNKLTENKSQANIFDLRNFLVHITIQQWVNSFSDNFNKRVFDTQDRNKIEKLTEEERNKKLFNFYVESGNTLSVSPELGVKPYNQFTSNEIKLTIEQTFKDLIHIIYLSSVIKLTGPEILSQLYQGDDDDEKRNYLQSFHLSHTPLADCVTSTNTIASMYDQNSSKKGGDQSWTLDGKNRQLDREEKMNQSAKTIQRAYKIFKDRKTRHSNAEEKNTNNDAPKNK